MTTLGLSVYMHCTHEGIFSGLSLQHSKLYSSLGRTAVPYFLFDLQVPEAADRGRSTQARTRTDDFSQGTNSDWKKILMLFKLNII